MHIQGLVRRCNEARDGETCYPQGGFVIELLLRW